jgi:hypothetical protein
MAIYGSVLPPANTILAKAPVPSLVPTFKVFFTYDSSNIAILADTKNSSCPKYCQYVVSVYGAEPSGCCAPTGVPGPLPVIAAQ